MEGWTDAAVRAGSAGAARPRLVLVHGIGNIHDPDEARREWTGALARGAVAAGHSAAAGALRDGSGADVVFAGYSDLFQPRRGTAQGAGEGEADGETEEEALLTLRLIGELVDAQIAEGVDDDSRAILEQARDRIRRARDGSAPQGPGEWVRVSLNVLTTLLELRGLRRAGQWTRAVALRGPFAQVSRYLSREPAKNPLDRLVRARVTTALGTGPAVVVAHSLGSVVALEALHESMARVPLLVTIGSPLGMRTVVWPHLTPRPPVTPESVDRWLNFWDRDDVIVSRASLSGIGTNSRRVGPESFRVDSDGLLVHSAVKYLEQPAVAGPVVEALDIVRDVV
ncbi:hypothetical protein [Streptomyces sp. NPDC047000]|uniref:hypothetical protein n=1 Tax=Streptomyces sp. NPDC047000 TaxID=3155474 RepID=UPI0033E93FD7